MEWNFGIGIVVGVATGALPGYVVTERVVERVAAFGRTVIVRVCAIGAALLALVPAFFLAVVLGGNFGGAWAAYLVGQWAVAIGIGLGIGLVLATCLCGAAIVGAIAGVVVSRALGKHRAA
jgi:hypothetical protein